MTAPEASPVVTAAREVLAQYRAATAEPEPDWPFIAGMLGAALESVLAQPGDRSWIVIGAGWSSTLRQLVRDGIAWNRQFIDESCPACAAEPYGCEAHDEHIGQISFYRQLAAKAGIEVSR